jgi:nucleotide-binding universal stress UspA family protein
MSYKDMLVQVDSSASSGERVDVAIKLARAFDAHLIGLYVAALAPIHQYAEADFGPDLVEAHDKYMREAADEAERKFRSGIEAASVKSEWRRLEGNLPELVLLNSRYVDLVVLGQRDPERLDPGTSPELPEHVILDVGRPVLVVPRTGTFPTVGEKILVAWTPSRGAVRGVNDALPLLQRAKQVKVLAVNPDTGLGGYGEVPGADIAQHLARHGVNVEAGQVTNAEKRIGITLMAEAEKFGADLIVCGAFGRSRFRELVLGGVTRRLLTEAKIPVLFSR